MNQLNKRITCSFAFEFFGTDNYLRFDVSDKDSHNWFIFECEKSNENPPYPAFEIKDNKQNKETLKELIKELTS